jgi:Staphylococcus phage HNH endonuclease
MRSSSFNEGERPIGYSIDRINNDGHYEAGNIRWASRQDQARNQLRGPRG